MDFASLPGEWLVVLPDHPDGHRVADVLEAAPQRVDHPSGRPWLLGRWGPGDLRVGTADRGRALAVLGFCSATTQRLGEIAARTSDPVTLDRLELAGSFHLMASVDGVSRFQGSVSGRRRGFHATVDGVPVAATRADVLAELVGAQVDRARLAVRLLVSEFVLTSVNESLWAGVRAVGEDCALLQYPDGRTVTRRRWVPPEADRPFAQAAATLRTALIDSVQVRLDAGLEMSADLSGGLDSTTLCFLASRGGRPLTTITYLECDVADEDPLWADRAAEHLPNLSRVLVPNDDLPPIYSDVLEPGPRADEPFPCVGDRPAFRMFVARLGRTGSRVHMSGDGGDETLTGASLGLLDLARREPRTALRHLRAQRAFAHWRWRDVASTLWDRRGGYPAWLARRARTVRVPSLEHDLSNLMVMPPWATAEATELVRDTLLAEAAASRRHERRWAAHHTIWAIRQSAMMPRSMSPFYAQQGMRITSPYFDDNVIDASLAAPAHLRSTPWSYKALLREAMRGIVPDRSLARSTKTEGSGLEYAGLRANADKLAALCEDSRLGRLGLIDPAILRTACTSLNLTRFTPAAISLTMSGERWLRDLEVPVGSDQILSPTNG